MFADVSCVYKDARGFRPSVDWLNQFNSQDVVEQERVYQILVDQVVEEIDAAKQHEHLRSKYFEKLILDTIASGAGSRETAIRWIVGSIEDEIGAQKEAGYACYLIDIPYRAYEAEIASAMGW